MHVFLRYQFISFFFTCNLKVGLEGCSLDLLQFHYMFNWTLNSVPSHVLTFLPHIVHIRGLLNNKSVHQQCTEMHIIWVSSLTGLTGYVDWVLKNVFLLIMWGKVTHIHVIECIYMSDCGHAHNKLKMSNLSVSRA